jgi:general secretion pathway protein A
MYLKYWKLARRPFDERLDPSWFFGSAHHEGMLLKLRCVVNQREPIAMLAGGTGTGKSMVATALTDSLSADVHPAVSLNASPPTAAEVLREILHELHHGGAADVAVADGPPDAKLTQALKLQLLCRAEAGQHPVVIVDAADLLPEPELHCLIRTLRELAAGNAAPATTLVIGSTELLVHARRFAASGADLFPQCVLDAMAPADTSAYVSHRLRLAGGVPAMFTSSAMQLIHDLSGGVPRRINRLCDLSLLMGYANNREQIDESLIWSAQREIRILSPSRTATAVAKRRWRPMGRIRTVIGDR